MNGNQNQQQQLQMQMQMHHQNGHGMPMQELDEEDEEYEQTDYAPEVRERISAQMRNEQIRRRHLDEMEEQRNQQEMMAREEQRLKKHVEIGFNANNRASNGYHMGQEPEADAELSMPSKPRKNVQFMQEAEIMSPKFSSPPSSQMSSSSNLKASPPQQQQQHEVQQSQDDFVLSTPCSQQPKRIILGDNSNDMGLNFERNEPEDEYTSHVTNTPCVIGANEIYVDQRLKEKQERMLIDKDNINKVEGEKLSFKEKMKLFAKQAGEQNIYDSEQKFKVSRKQREIESKFEAAK